MKYTDFSIDLDSCSHCGACSEECPAFVIGLDDQGYPYFINEHMDLCINCGHCMAICRTKSIITGGMDYEVDFYDYSEKDPIFSMLEQRRSFRRFRDKPVEQDLLERILFAISQAPHAVEHQNVEITVINDREKIMEALPMIATFYRKLGKWLKNPFIRYMIQRNKGRATINTLMNHLLPRIEKNIYNRIEYEYDSFTRGAHTLMIFHAHVDSEEHTNDAMIFVTYAMLSAHALGLGTTIIGLVPAALNKHKGLRELFNIPDNHNSVSSIIIGYPKYKYQRGIKRDLKDVHWLN